MHIEFHFRQSLKSWVLPMSMLGGILLHDYIDKLSTITPYLIFTMLTITYTRLEIKEFRVTAFQWALLSIQLLGGTASYIALLPIDSNMAAGAFICFFMPTATAAPVITGMLGGSITKIATYSLLSLKF